MGLTSIGVTPTTVTFSQMSCLRRSALRRATSSAADFSVFNIFTSDLGRLNGPRASHDPAELSRLVIGESPRRGQELGVCYGSTAIVTVWKALGEELREVWRLIKGHRVTGTR